MTIHKQIQRILYYHVHFIKNIGEGSPLGLMSSVVMGPYPDL